MSERTRVAETIGASGMVLWRRAGNSLQVLLVHRSKYDDWSWPKGKLDPGESWIEAAVREVAEETGLRGRVGIPLPDASYPLRSGELKHVKYWAGEAVDGDGVLEHEIDAVAWLPVDKAMQRLSYVRDSVQLQALVDADQQFGLKTWPLLVVRHAHATSRDDWDDDDQLRPLSDNGYDRALALTPVLAAYALEKVVCSPSTRCRETVGPFLSRHDIKTSYKKAFSEEGFADDPRRAIRHLRKTFDRAEPVAICSHGPVLPTMLLQLAAQAAPHSLAATRLRSLATDGMEKGEVLACHMAGVGDAVRVVAVERHLP